jgi:hypothetical protein
LEGLIASNATLLMWLLELSTQKQTSRHGTKLKQTAMFLYREVIMPWRHMADSYSCLVGSTLLKKLYTTICTFSTRVRLEEQVAVSFRLM